MVCLQQDTPNLVTLLRHHGYSTCLLGKNHIVEWNLHKKWFDATPSWNFEKPQYLPDTQPSPQSTLWRADYRGTIDLTRTRMDRHQDAVTAQETIDYFTRCKKEKRSFFALVDIGKPHPVYEDYSGYPALNIPLEQIALPPIPPLEKAPFIDQCLRKSKNLESLTPEERQRITRAYYSMCEFADHQVLKILEALDQLDMAKDTLVIYGADHGDFAGERNCYEKWDTAFYECIVNVPLIMRLPGKIPAGKKSDALLELIDIKPTLLDFLGHPIPRSVQGRSLKPLLEGKQSAHKKAVFCQGGVEEDLLRRPSRPEKPSVKQQVLLDFPEAMGRAKMVRDSRYKYIHRLFGECELYDLQKDPHELANEIHNPAYSSELTRLKDLLLRHLIEAETNLPEVNELTA